MIMKSKQMWEEWLLKAKGQGKLLEQNLLSLSVKLSL